MSTKLTNKGKDELINKNEELVNKKLIRWDKAR